MDWMTYQRDSKARRNVERIIENVANAVIDIAKILLAASALAAPPTYRDVLQMMAPAGLADPETALELIRLAPLRNSLAHGYLDYKWEGVKWFLQSGGDAVVAWLQAYEASSERGASG